MNETVVLHPICWPLLAQAITCAVLVTVLVWGVHLLTRDLSRSHVGPTSEWIAKDTPTDAAIQTSLHQYAPTQFPEPAPRRKPSSAVLRFPSGGGRVA